MILIGAIFINMNEEIEVFVDIPDYEGLYQVSNLGRVRSLAKIIYRSNGRMQTWRERILRPGIKDTGYYHVQLCRNKIHYDKKVHQLVAITFLNHIPRGLSLVVNHIDGNKLNNKLLNIEIVTTRQNTSTCYRSDRLRLSSQYTGVNWNKKVKKWESGIKINGRRKYLGCFSSEIEASNVYKKALSELLNKKDPN